MEHRVGISFVYWGMFIRMFLILLARKSLPISANSFHLSSPEIAIRIFRGGGSCKWFANEKKKNKNKKNNVSPKFRVNIFPYFIEYIFRFSAWDFFHSLNEPLNSISSAARCSECFSILFSFIFYSLASLTYTHDGWVKRNNYVDGFFSNLHPFQPLTIKNKTHYSSDYYFSALPPSAQRCTCVHT